MSRSSYYNHLEYQLKYNDRGLRSIGLAMSDAELTGSVTECSSPCGALSEWSVETGQVGNLWFSVGSTVLTTMNMKSIIFWYITPYSIRISPTFRRNIWLHLPSPKVSVKMKAVCSFETTKKFYQTTPRYIPRT
jgi:hypothetical protein